MGQTVADLRVEEAGTPRALRVEDFSEATVAAIEEAALVVAAVRDRLPAALDGGRLAVRADGTVALSQATLDALEQILITGTVTLDGPSLAALEQITAVGPLTDTQLRASPVGVESSSASKGNGKLAVAGVSTALTAVDVNGTPGIPAGATRALFLPDAAMTLTDDGTAAAVDDYPLDAGEEWVYDGDRLAQVKLFGTGNVKVWFYA